MRRFWEWRLEAYRDGALSGRQRRRVERRAESDPASARHLRATEALGAAVRAAWTEGAPAPSNEYLIAALRPRMAQIDAELGKRPARRWLGALGLGLRPLPAVAFAGAALVALYLALPRLVEPPGSALSPPSTAVAETPDLAPGQGIYDLAQGDSPLMILEAEDGSTVIWILEDGEQLSLFPASRDGWA